MSENRETVRSHFWEEVADPDDPFSAASTYCAGYNVYEDIISKATWVEYLFLLFRGERPTSVQARLLEVLALAIANPGPRDYSVRAAMNGGVGGSTSAASLMAALAVGAGKLGGAREVYSVVGHWHEAGCDLGKWEERLVRPEPIERADIWPEDEHAPGFAPHAQRVSAAVETTLNLMTEVSPEGHIAWLSRNRMVLEQHAGAPLAMTGLAAVVLFELGFEPDQAEMLFLLLRLPGAAVHALEQKQAGWRHYPFFHEGLTLLNDPEGR